MRLLLFSLSLFLSVPLSSGFAGDIGHGAVVGAVFAGTEWLPWASGRNAPTAAFPLADMLTGEESKMLAILAGIVIGTAAVIVAWRYLTGQRNSEIREISPDPLRVKTYHEPATVKDVAKLETDMHNRLTNVDAYIHKMTHDIAAQLQGIMTTGQDREERMMARMTEMARECSVSVGRLHDKVETTHANQRKELDDKITAQRLEQDVKIAAVREETAEDLKEIRVVLGEMPNRLVDLLRNTGAIGRRAS